MIRTITIQGGESACAEAVLEHAIRMAVCFGSHLRVVTFASPKEERELALHEENAEDLAVQLDETLLKRAESAGISVHREFHGDSRGRGMIEEARSSDLLVLGFPTAQQAQTDPQARHAIHDQIPVLRKAECSLLVVNKLPVEMKNVFVYYHGGVEGKAALRLAGMLAEKTGAAITVLAVEQDMTTSVTMTAAATAYLEGYQLPFVKTIERKGMPQSEADVVPFAESSAADIIVLGDEPYGVFDSFFGRSTGERYVMGTALPVLLAR